jgi:hypothetical protein
MTSPVLAESPARPLIALAGPSRRVAAPKPGRWVLFATDLADPPAAAVAMLHHLARTGPLLVDVLHVAKSAAAAADAEPRMHEVLAGLTNLVVRGRIVLDTDVPAAIGRACARHPYHLVMAPSAPARPWRRSKRAALVAGCPVPLWTTGDTASAGRTTAIRRVACEVTLEPRGDRHLPFARDLAARLGAKLVLVHVVPPIDDGTIVEAATAMRPLHAVVARARLEALAGPEAVEIAVATGPRAATLRQLLLATGADLLCVPAADAAGPWWMASHLRGAPCPVVCAGPQAHRAWRDLPVAAVSPATPPLELAVSL